MTSKINLRRNRRTHVMFGILLVLVGGLMLVNPGYDAEHFVFGTFFLVSGLLSMSYLNRLVLEGGREIIHQRGLVFPMLSKRYPVNKVRNVKISQRVIRKKDKDRSYYAVELSGIRDAVLSRHPNPWFSRVVAEQLARRIGVPLDNRVYGVSSRRQANDLDMPLVRRWIRDGKRFDKPILTATTDLTENVGASSYELSLIAEFPKFKYAVAGFFLIAALAVANVPPAFIFESWFYRAVAGFALIAGVMGLSFVGRSKFKMDPEQVSFRQGSGPFRNRMRLDEIEEFVVASDGVIMIGDEKAVWVHWGKNQADSDYLAATIPYHLLRIGRRSRGFPQSDE